MSDDRSDMDREIYVERIISQCLFDILLIQNMSIDVKGFLKKHGINKIAIHGMGKLGKAFLSMLIKSGVDVVYGVDRDRNIEIENFDLKHSINEMTAEVDIVVITSELSYRDIDREIKTVIDVPTIVVRDMLEGMLLVPQSI